MKSINIILFIIAINLTSNRLVGQKNFKLTAELGLQFNYNHRGDIKPFSFDYSLSTGVLGKVTDKSFIEIKALCQLLTFNKFIGEGSFPSQGPYFETPAKIYNYSRIIYLGPEISYYYKMKKLSPFISISYNVNLVDYTNFKAYEDNILIDYGNTRANAIGDDIPSRYHISIGILTKGLLKNDRLPLKLFYSYQLVQQNTYNERFNSFSSLGINVKI